MLLAVTDAALFISYHPRKSHERKHRVNWDDVGFWCWGGGESGLRDVSCGLLILTLKGDISCFFLIIINHFCSGDS